MRSYAKNFMFKKTATYKQRQVRLATEWDVRLDVGDQLPIEDIVNNCKKIKDDCLYILVSGVERPDEAIQATHGKEWANQSLTRSNQEHVHLCIVLLEPKTRPDVLRMLRGPRKVLDEYCTPRNSKFAYAGWVIHHAKPELKIPGQPPIRFECGTLPMDPLTIEWALKIDAILKKWGYDATRVRFRQYTDLIKKHKTLEKIEGLLMSLEDNDATAAF